MRVKFGSLVTEGSGALGGHVFQNSNYGAQLRSKPIPGGKPSFAQSIIRSYNSKIHGGWRNLTDQQRSIWNNAAQYPLSGSQFWYQVQYTRLHEGLPFLYNPYKKLDTYLGTEMVDQVGWCDASLSFWTYKSGTWVGTGSELQFSLLSGNLRNPGFWDIGSYYQIRASAIINSGVLILPSDASQPYCTVNLTGDYICNYSPDSSTAMWLINQSGIGSVTQFSIKPIFHYNG